MDTFNKLPLNPPPSLREKQPFTSVDTPVDANQALPGANRKILIVDDDAIVLKTFQLKLKGCGFNVISAAEAAEGIGAVRRERPEAVILDLNFPPGENFSSLNWNGMHILQWLKRYRAGCRRLRVFSKARGFKSFPLGASQAYRRQTPLITPATSGRWRFGARFGQNPVAPGCFARRNKSPSGKSPPARIAPASAE
jgi:CheY-like chemotaxis protein